MLGRTSPTPMSRWFNESVWLAENANSACVADGTLKLVLFNTHEVRSHLERVDLPTTVKYRGKEVSLAHVPDGEKFRLEIRDIDGRSSHIAESLEVFLGQHDGAFFRDPPSQYYLISDRYRSGDSPTNESISGFLRLPAFFGLLRDFCDVELKEDVVGKLVLLAGKRLVVTLSCEAVAMKHVPSIEAIEGIRERVLGGAHAAEKKELFKKVLVRQLEGVDQARRLGRMLERFDALVHAFETDYECFLSDFNFERRRAEIERQRAEYVEKMNRAGADVLGKILAIPVGQGVIVSQLSNEAGKALGNLGLVIGSFVFFVIGWVLIVTLRHSLVTIEQELNAELKVLAENSAMGGTDIATAFAPTQKRLWLLTHIVPRLVLLLLLLTFVYSVFAFLQVPPGDAMYGYICELVQSW